MVLLHLGAPDQGDNQSYSDRLHVQSLTELPQNSCIKLYISKGMCMLWCFNNVGTKQ